jgi:hypothetical protein
MAQIGTLASGNGTVTNIAGLSQLDEFILVGDVDTANPLQGLTVEVNGDTLINIQNQSLITGFAKWMMETAGAVVGLMLKVSTGRIKGSTNLRFVNTGATTPTIFSFSDSDAGTPIFANTETVLAGSYKDFESFTSLIMHSPANVGQCTAFFSNGFSSNMTAAEIAGYFALENQSEVDGYLGGCLVVDNRDGRYKGFRVNAVTANLNVLVVKIPEVV